MDTGGGLRWLTRRHEGALTALQVHLHALSLDYRFALGGYRASHLTRVMADYQLRIVAKGCDSGDVSVHSTRWRA